VGALVALIASLLGMLVVAAVGYTVTRSNLTTLLTTAAHFAISPFVLSAAALSGLTVVAVHLLRPR
jgi:hypothetical protein